MKKKTLLSELSTLKEKVNLQVNNNKSVVLEQTGDETCITAIPSYGYTIVKPGVYTFGNDINWTPSGLLSSAITIACGDVLLDMKNFKLEASGANCKTSIGINVSQNGGNICCNTVVIKNGTIKNMGFYGITASNTYGLKIQDMVVDQLTYPYFDVLPPSGILVQEAYSFIIDNCKIQNINVTAIMATGILLMKANMGTVSNCNVNNLTNNDGVTGAYVYNNCSLIESSNCETSNLRTYFNADPLSVIGHTCIGFMPTDSNNLTFTNCKATEITGCCDDCHGMSLFTVNTAVVYGFFADGILDGNCVEGACQTKTGAKATGLEVYGNNILVRNSTVQNIFAIVPQNLQATGFSACGAKITFENCSARNVKVWNSNQKPDTNYGYGCGFGWAPDPRPQYVIPAVSVSYDNCVSSDCQVGFDTWNHQNSVWKNAQSISCGIGIMVEAINTLRTYSMNFCSELPDANPLSPSKQFPIYNCAEDNTYPGG
jgi:hypothetical protein